MACLAAEVDNRITCRQHPSFKDSGAAVLRHLAVASGAGELSPSLSTAGCVNLWLPAPFSRIKQRRKPQEGCFPLGGSYMVANESDQAISCGKRLAAVAVVVYVGD